MTQILEHKHPSINDIHRKMLERLMLPEKVVSGVTYKCAEVAESLMMDAVLNTKKKVVTFETVKSHPKLQLTYDKNVSGRYSCKCGNRRIYETHRFCSGCGIEIEWLKV